jgi:hypothetical protein
MNRKRYDILDLLIELGADLDAEDASVLHRAGYRHAARRSGDDALS